MSNVVIGELVAERSDLDAGPAVAPFSLQPCARFRLTAGGVEALDSVLEPAAYRPVDLTNGANLLNATSDLTQVVAVDEGCLAYAGPTGQRSGSAGLDWQLGLPPADSATFLGQNRLLVTVPDQRNTGHRVLLMDTATGVIVDEVKLDAFDAVAFATAHPGDGSVLVDLGEGQDGSSLYRVRVEDDRLTTTRILENVVACGFSPDGTRLLLLPHPSLPEAPQVLSWPSLEVLAVADLDAAGIDQDGIDLYGCFLDHDRVLLSTHEQGFWLARADLTAITPIELPEQVTGTAPEFSLTLGLSADTFSTRIWRDDRDLSTVWRLRPRTDRSSNT